MKEAKARPTQGPWMLETVKTSVGVCHKIGPFPNAIPRADRPHTYACVYEDGMSNHRLLAIGTLDSELLANARLIAAAPDLLEALRRTTAVLQSAFSRRPVRDMTETLAEARSAIAKADGSTPLEVTHETV